MKITWNQLRKINTASSFEFSSMALQYLQNYIKNAPVRNMDSFLAGLNDQGRALIKLQPNMAGLKKKVAVVVYTVKKAMKTKKSNAGVVEYTLKKIAELLAAAREQKEKIAAAGSKLITPNARILTIGNSALVSEILCTAINQKRKFEVYCLESAPTREGIILAETLAHRGISTYLASDAAAGSILQQATLVMCGAVRIYEEGFVNKIGTLSLALTACSMKLPFYLACDTDKILPECDYALRFFRYNPDEIYKTRNRNLKIFNIYYESVPLALLTKLITEDGVFDLTEFKNWYLKD